MHDEQITIYGEGTQIRDFNYVDDVVDAFLRAGATDAANGQVQNGQIILTAGAGDTDGSITFSGGNFTSSVNASATGNILASGNGSRLNFGADAFLGRPPGPAKQPDDGTG